MTKIDEKHETDTVMQKLFWFISLLGLLLLFFVFCQLFAYPQNTSNLVNLFENTLKGKYTAFFGTLFLTLLAMKLSGQAIEFKNLRKNVYSFCGISFFLLVFTFTIISLSTRKPNLTFHFIFAFYLACFLGAALLQEGYIRNIGLFLLGSMTIISILLAFVAFTGWIFESIDFTKGSIFLSANLFIIAIIMGVTWNRLRAKKE